MLLLLHLGVKIIQLKRNHFLGNEELRKKNPRKHQDEIQYHYKGEGKKFGH
jgi:hypothetical protein